MDMLPVTVVVMATPPTVVLILTTVNIMVVNLATNVGPRALLPTGTNDQAIITALTSLKPALLIPARHTTPQQLESVSLTSSVWGTVTVMLTNMAVPSTIAGGPYTNIKIRVEMNRISLRFVTSQGPHRAKNILARASIPTYRVSPLVLPRYAKFEDFLSIPADFPAPPRRAVISKRLLGRTSHMQRRRHPRIARIGASGLPIPLR
jgi:hypothetical protein